MPHTLVFDMPMKLSLKLMASVCSDRVKSEGEFFDHIINKLNGILLIVTRIDFQRPDPGGIVNRRVLKAPDSVALKIPQRDKLDIHLDMMTQNLFGITSSMNRSARRILRQSSHTVSD
jgi:hypothetical protein